MSRRLPLVASLLALSEAGSNCRKRKRDKDHECAESWRRGVSMSLPTRRPDKWVVINTPNQPPDASDVIAGHLSLPITGHKWVGAAPEPFASHVGPRPEALLCGDVWISWRYALWEVPVPHQVEP